MEFAFVSLPPNFICSLVKNGSAGPSTVTIAPPPRSYFFPTSAFSCCAPDFSTASLYSSKKLLIDFILFFTARGGGGAFAPFFGADVGEGAGVERSTPLSITVKTL